MICRHRRSEAQGCPECATETMAFMDRLSPGFRALVHDFGFVIVAKSLNEGEYRDPEALRADLEIWRQRQQTEWLRTNYVTDRLRRSFDVPEESEAKKAARARAALKAMSPEKLQAMILEEAAKYA